MFKSLHFKSFLLFMLAMFIGGVNSAWAADKQNVSNVTTSFSATGNVTSNFTQSGDFTAATWSLDVTWKNGASWQAMNASKGSQVGSGSKPASSIILTGTNIPGTIKSVKVNSSVASGGATTVGVVVGSTTFQCNNASTATLQTSAADYTFTGEASGNVVLTWTQSSSSKAIYIKSVTITYEESDPSDTRAETTVTIDDSGITNTNVYAGTAAGSLSATVKAGDDAVSGASVTWSSDDTDVATIDASTGVVTLVGAGSTIITASFAGDETNYKPSTDTYELTVTNTDPNAPGTENNPYTVAQAIQNTPSSGTSDNVYIKGIVSKFYKTDIVSDGTNYRYYISDDGTETNQLQLLVYKGKGLNNVAFSSAEDLQIGDEVVILGGLTTYNNAPEVAVDNYIVSLQRKTLSSITLSGDYTTSFVEGSEFNHEGVVVTATYSDQTTDDVTLQADFSDPDMTQLGEQTITVSYGGKSTSYNITITETPTHTATFSVNGTTSTEDFKEGAAITFPSVTAPTGYTFMGWTETAISTTQETAPADLTSSATMGNDDVKYYAVFAVGTGSAPSLTKMVADDNLEDGDKVVIVAHDGEDNYALYQETVSNSYVKYYMFDGTYASVIADDKNWVTVVAGSDGTWKFGDDTNGYLYNSGSNNLSVSTESSTEWTLEDNNDGTFKLKAGRYLSCRSDLSGTNKYLFRMAGGTPAGIYSFEIYKVAAGGGYSDYCTTIQPVAITITAAGAASFSTTFPLDFTGVEGITAYAATLKTDKYVHLDPVTTIPSGEGIIVKGAQGTYNVPVATGEVTLDCSEENLLKGTATEAKVISKDEAATERFYKYVQSTESGKVGFQKVLSTASEEKRTCAKGRAYLELTDEQQARFIGFADEEGGIATGINAIDNSQLTIDNDAPAYNLAGQKVGKGYKGIVVKNGKKYVK